MELAASCSQCNPDRGPEMTIKFQQLYDSFIMSTLLLWTSQFANYNNAWQYRSPNAPSRNLVLKNTCNTLCTWMSSLLCGLMGHQVTWCWEAHVTPYALLIASLPFGSSQNSKWSDFEKLLSHFDHLKGFSSVWFLHAPSKNLILKTLVTLCALEWLLSSV